MQAAQFRASAAKSLIDGYRDDFVSFAAVLAQTLEQISMRNIDIGDGRASLEHLERSMRALAEAIQDLMSGKPVSLPQNEPPASEPDQGTGPSSGESSSDVAKPLESEQAPREEGAWQLGLRDHAPGKQYPEDEDEEEEPQEQVPQNTSRRPRALVTPSSVDEGSTLRGTNQSMPMLSVCQFLGRVRKDGILHVTIVDEELTFEFVRGWPGSRNCTRSRSSRSILQWPRSSSLH